MNCKAIADILNETARKLCELTENCKNNCINCPLFNKGLCIIDYMAYIEDNCFAQIYQKD